VFAAVEYEVDVFVQTAQLATPIHEAVAVPGVVAVVVLQDWQPPERTI